MKKGRVLSLLLTLPLLLSVPPAMADSHVFLQDGTVELEYVLLDDGTVEITHYSGTATTLEFPDTLDGRPVSTISTIAFYDIAFHEDDIQTLTDITIPASVTVIGYNVFHTCADLTNITVSADNPCFTSIDGVLFRKTGGALVAYPAGRQDTAYSIPKGTASIGDYAFYGCEQLEDITVPDSVTEIGEEAFCGCASLTDIAIPDSVTKIGGGAFWGCTSLTDITVPDSVTEIGMDAFKGCDNLTLTVLRDSYAAQYAQEEKLKYGYDGHVKIVGGDVNIRAEPDKTAGKLGYIKYGRTVRYLGRSSVDDRGVCWYEIRYNGVTGWVSSRYSEIA